MLRTSLVKSARSLTSQRLFSTSLRAMAGGDTGSAASRATGVRGGDAFTKRESAAEELYIRQEEIAKLKAIRAKLEEQQAHITELTKHIDEVTKESGGQGEHQT